MSIFDVAYKHFFDSLRNLEEFAVLILGCLIYLTTPIWVIPYVIIKKVRGKDNG